MLKKLFVFLLLCTIIISCVSCSVSLPWKKPQSGFWYCEELKTGIDFDLYQTTNYCVIVYQDDGSFVINGFHSDHGNGLHFCVDVDDEHIAYFYGNYKFYENKGKFVITSRPDGIKYTFVERERKDR